MGATVVIIAIVLTVIVVSLLVRRSRKKSYKLEPNKDIGLLSYNNAMYDVGKETNTFSAQSGNCICCMHDQGLFVSIL